MSANQIIRLKTIIDLSRQPATLFFASAYLQIHVQGLFIKLRAELQAPQPAAL